MTARDTITKLEELGSVEDALLFRLFTQLQEVKAAQAEIDSFLRRSTEMRLMRTSLLLEAATTAAENEGSSCIHRLRTAPTLRLVQ